jgi:3-deoxy-D-manno-octulosonic-acid transferase
MQDRESLHLAQSIGIRHASLSGDTRFDRVVQVAQQFPGIDKIEAFRNGAPLLVAGSTWSDDEFMLREVNGIRMIIAPHEIHEEHLQQIEAGFPGAIRYSAYEPGKDNANVLIIDNVGMLSRLYHYADITYIGGGFSRDGIHNILEAAVWAKPVIIGPNYNKYREATEMIAAGGCFSFAEKEALKTLAKRLLADDIMRIDAGQKASAYIDKNVGATKIIIDWIQENRLLTSS